MAFYRQPLSFSPQSKRNNKQSAKNIHVQQDKTNIINEEWNKMQNDAPFVTFYDMRAVVTFVPPDEMVDVSIMGLQWFIPRLSHMRSHRPSDSHSKPYFHRKKILDLEQPPPNLLQYYELRKAAFCL